MARRALSWPMISVQALASALDSTGTTSGQHVQRRASGVSSANPVFVLMPQLLEGQTIIIPPFPQGGETAHRALRPAPGSTEGPDAAGDELRPDI